MDYFDARNYIDSHSCILHTAIHDYQFTMPCGKDTATIYVTGSRASLYIAGNLIGEDKGFGVQEAIDHVINIHTHHNIAHSLTR